MCCQIVDRKSVAPSSGNFRRRPAPRYECGQDQKFWRKLVCFFAWRAWWAWRGCPKLKIWLLFFVLKIFFFLLKHHGDLWSTGKSCVQARSFIGILEKNIKWILEFCWIKPCFKGSGGYIPKNPVKRSKGQINYWGSCGWFQPTATALPLFTWFIQWKMAPSNSKTVLFSKTPKFI